MATYPTSIHPNYSRRVQPDNVECWSDDDKMKIITFSFNKNQIEKKEKESDSTRKNKIQTISAKSFRLLLNKHFVRFGIQPHYSDF